MKRKQPQRPSAIPPKTAEAPEYLRMMYIIETGNTSWRFKNRT